MNFKSAWIRLAGVSALIFANLGMALAQSDSIHQLSAGTRLSLKLDVELSSKAAGVNDTFIAVVAKPVMVRDIVVIPIGTVINGRVIRASAAAHGHNGDLAVVFDTLRIPMLPVREIDGELVKRIDVPRSPFLKVISIVGGTVAGAIIGTALKGSSGSAIGAGAGAAAGTGYAFLRKGRDVRIREDREFEIVLKKDVTLPVLDY